MAKEPKKPAVERIVISIGGKEISISLDEAKELKRVLTEAFGEHYTYYYPIYNQTLTTPIIQHPLQPQYPYTVTSSTGGNIVGSSNYLLTQ